MKQSSPRARQTGASHDGGGDGPLHGDPMERRVWKDEVCQLGIATGQWHIWRIAACLVGAAKSSKSQFHLTLRNLGSGPFTFEVFDAFRISCDLRGQKSCELPWLIMVPVAQHVYLQRYDSGKHAKYALEMNLSTNGGGQEICHDLEKPAKWKAIHGETYITESKTDENKYLPFLILLSSRLSTPCFSCHLLR